MYILPISIFLLSYLFVAISTSEQSSGSHKKATQFNGHHDECVCFPAGQSILPELQNPNLERLVLYLYHDINNNQIKMFLPGPEKQALIPNVPFEIGDVLRTVTTDPIASLFAVNIKSGDDQHQTLESQPIGLKQGSIRQHGNPKSVIREVWQDYPPQDSAYQNYAQELHLPGEKQHIKLPIETIGLDRNKTSKPFAQKINNSHQPHKSAGTPFMTNAPDNNSIRENVTFDKWFTQQMGMFQDLKSHADKSVNTNSLRSLVQKALLENHIHISPTGQITDENGVQINLSNIELRPILIGKSVKYQQALTADQQLPVPRHLPYLEGIVISLIQPTKILSLIPLGKTYVSQQTQSSPTIDHYYSDTDSTPNLNPGVNLPNPYKTPTQSNQMTYENFLTSNLTNPISHVLGGLTKPLSANVKLAFGGLPFSSSLYGNIDEGLQSNTMWSRRSSKTSSEVRIPKKPKRKSKMMTNQPKESSNSISTQPLPQKAVSWFKSFLRLPNPAIISRDGHKSGIRYYENWQSSSNSPWKSYFTNHDYHNNDGKLFAYPWNPSSLNSDDGYYTYHHSQPQAIASSPYGFPNTGYNSDPKRPYTYYNQSIYPDPQVILAQPVVDEYSTISDQPSGYFTPQISAQPLQRIYSNLLDSVEPVQSIYSTPITSGQPMESIHSRPANPVGVSSSFQNTYWMPTPSAEWYAWAVPDEYPYIANNPVQSPYLRSKLSSDEVKVPSQKVHFKKPIFFDKTEEPQFNHRQIQHRLMMSELNENNLKPQGGTRRFPLPIIQSVLKSLINIVLQNLSQGTGSGGTETITKSDSSINIANHIQKSSEFEAEERPDFRIIGGSAATVSGSPVSNKGRSGTYLQIKKSKYNY